MAKLILNGKAYESWIEIQSSHNNGSTISIRDPQMPSFEMAIIELDEQDNRRIRRFYDVNYPKQPDGDEDINDGR